MLVFFFLLNGVKLGLASKKGVDVGKTLYTVPGYVRSVSAELFVSLGYLINKYYKYYVNYMYVWSSHIQQKGKDQPGKVAYPARNQLRGKINISLSPFAP